MSLLLRSREVKRRLAGIFLRPFIAHAFVHAKREAEAEQEAEPHTAACHIAESRPERLCEQPRRGTFTHSLLSCGFFGETHSVRCYTALPLRQPCCAQTLPWQLRSRV